MEIQKINSDLASSASHIYALSWKEAYKNIISKEYLDNLSLERWTPFLKNSPFDGYILKDKGKYIATGSISKARDEKMQDWGEIISLYVLPEYFFKGYGKELFSFLVTELESKGYENIYLWVLEENYQARNFYERNGFFPNGDKMTIEIAGKELIEIRYVNKVF